MATKLLILDSRNKKAALHALAREIKARRGRLRRPPPILFPTSVQRQYAADLYGMCGVMNSLTKTRLVAVLPALMEHAKVSRPSIQDSAELNLDAKWGKNLTSTIQGVKFEFGRRYTDKEVRQLAEKTGKSVSYWNKKQLTKTVSRVLDIDPIQHEPWLQDELHTFAERNVGLITSISDRYFSEVQGIVYDAFQKGSSLSDVVSDLTDRFDVSESRATLIARDQVGKLQGQLVQLRQTALGIDAYIWRNCQDERVRGNPDGLYPDARPSHWAREGKQFRWDNPPEGGHPGEDIQCRCYAEAVLDPDLITDPDEDEDA